MVKLGERGSLSGFLGAIRPLSIPVDHEHFGALCHLALTVTAPLAVSQSRRCSWPVYVYNYVFKAVEEVLN
ncbi:hypothetical protein EVAR_39629_1 [Eumeta japonica]|uniref:Uncharacterized protein n=1 Tax=Eumeta variegata TaxID=151549 RepID=A0A4C1WHQ4_EUMVA|nr:hypothetical protein EVAR_39629_1 [Eumeta japonica]